MSDMTDRTACRRARVAPPIPQRGLLRSRIVRPTAGALAALVLTSAVAFPHAGDAAAATTGTYAPVAMAGADTGPHRGRRNG